MIVTRRRTRVRQCERASAARRPCLCLASTVDHESAPFSARARPRKPGRSRRRCSRACRQAPSPIPAQARPSHTSVNRAVQCEPNACQRYANRFAEWCGECRPQRSKSARRGECLFTASQHDQQFDVRLPAQRPRQQPPEADVLAAAPQTAALAFAPGMRDGVRIGEVAVRRIVVGREACHACAEQREVLAAVALRLTAARRLQIDDAVHARVDAGHVALAAGLEQHGLAGIAQLAHERQHARA